MKRIARIAAATLLMLWVGPVSFIQNDTGRLLRLLGAPGSASAAGDIVPAGKALELQPGAQLKLLLRDGSRVRGSFLGRTLMDSALYAQRFAKRAGKPPRVWLAMGETLRVTLNDGREWTAPFAGYGERSLLLRGPDPEPLRVPFEYAKDIVRANGESVAPKALAAVFRSGKLPSAEVLALDGPSPIGTEEERWALAQRVAADDIESVMLVAPGADVVGVMVLTALGTAVIVVVLMGVAFNNASKDCGSDLNLEGLNLLGAVAPHGSRLTTRPFDRSRGCYVGDDLAVADPWRSAAVSGPAVAAADAATSESAAR